MLAFDIVGRDGLRLKDKWAAGPRTYLGLATAGFPNLFIITGPGSPSVLSNMILSIEQHVDWIAGAIDAVSDRRCTQVEATADAEEAWTIHVDDVGKHTLYPAADSWYMGANVPGKPRLLMPYVGGAHNYRASCERVVADGYAGFVMSNPGDPHA